MTMKPNKPTSIKPPTLTEQIEDAPAVRAKLLQEVQDALRAGALGDAFKDDYTARGVIHRGKTAVLPDGTIVTRS